MTEADRTSARSTSEIFLEFYRGFEIQDPKQARRLEYALQCQFGKSAVGNSDLSLVPVIVQYIEEQVALKSAEEAFTPESYIAFLFSPGSNSQQVSAPDFMKRLLLGNDNKQL